MITGPLKSELLEVFDRALRDLSALKRALEDVSNLVSVANLDLRLSHDQLINELGISLAQANLIRYGIDEAKTYEGRRREK
ncbi:hypothetical protein [Amycolatopsis keratiniphila]|uniref:hypothetical protein n=1 Tax=Amycolatopsis keratiniphila TaxID=129921 RepID=UPI00039B2F93|nr:hypothetical protein [Amycolatopsis keratiniphila]